MIKYEILLSIFFLSSARLFGMVQDDEHYYLDPFAQQHIQDVEQRFRDVEQKLRDVEEGLEENYRFIKNDNRDVRFMQEIEEEENKRKKRNIYRKYEPKLIKKQQDTLHDMLLKAAKIFIFHEACCSNFKSRLGTNNILLSYNDFKKMMLEEEINQIVSSIPLYKY